MQEESMEAVTSPMAFPSVPDGTAFVPYSPVMPREDMAGPYPRHPLTFSVGEAAQLLGVSAKAVRSAVEKGQIEGIRVGRLIRVVRAPLLKQLGLPDDYDPGFGNRRFP
jgi:excisionase family DNA binding protein